MAAPHRRSGGFGEHKGRDGDGKEGDTDQNNPPVAIKKAPRNERHDSIHGHGQGKKQGNVNVGKDRRSLEMI